MQFDIISIFPEAFTSYFQTSILKRAQQKKSVLIRVHNLRDFTTDKHKTVDDKPYGGGAGMVLKVEPLYRCISQIVPIPSRILDSVGTNRKSLTSPHPSPARRGRSPRSKVVLLAAGGKQFDQRMAEKFAKLDRLILIAGHYEGVDERVMKFVDEAVSVGPYVLTGGELPAMTIVDAVTRLVPGVLGNEESLTEESFSPPSLRGDRQSRLMKQSQIMRSLDKLGMTLHVRLSRLCRGSSIAMRSGLLHQLADRNDSVKEYPHYTRPEIFEPKRGVRWAVPKVLLSGDHAKIAAWRIKHMGRTGGKTRA